MLCEYLTTYAKFKKKCFIGRKLGSDSFLLISVELVVINLREITV